MKKVIFWLLVFGSIGGGYLATNPTWQKADNIEQAKTLVNEDGYAIFVFADGWDKFSKKAVDRMLASRRVGRALGDTVVMTAGIPDVSSQQDHESLKTRFGNMDVPVPDSYPAIHLYNKDGAIRTTVTIMNDECDNPKAVAEKITVARDAMRKQLDLMKQAEAAIKKQEELKKALKDSPIEKQEELKQALKDSTIECGKLLGAASAVPGVRKPANVNKLLKEADPEDISGMMKIATLDLHGTAEASASTKDWKAMLEEMKALLENPLLTTEQKQQVCCISIGLLRRNGGRQHQEEIKSMIKKLNELDPNSVLGKSAIDANRLWISNLNLIEGWKPGNLPEDEVPTEVQGAKINEAGSYNVTFNFTNGTHALYIEAVELYDGKNKVAEDRHFGSTGHKNNNNVYTLNVQAPVSEPHLFVTVKMGNDRNSYGKIIIEKK